LGWIHVMDVAWCFLDVAGRLVTESARLEAC
jgi:hypothetical protein